MLHLAHLCVQVHFGIIRTGGTAQLETFRQAQEVIFLKITSGAHGLTCRSFQMVFL